MGDRFARFALLLAAMAVHSGAAAVTSSHSRPNDCRLVGSEKLPAAAGGDSICTAIAQAMAAQAPASRYSVEVRVLSKSRMSAVLVVNGRTLPTQNLAVSDGELGPRQIRRFADTLAAIAAKA